MSSTNHSSLLNERGALEHGQRVKLKAVLHCPGNIQLRTVANWYDDRAVQHYINRDKLDILTDLTTSLRQSGIKTVKPSIMSHGNDENIALNDKAIKSYDRPVTLQFTTMNGVTIQKLIENYELMVSQNEYFNKRLSQLSREQEMNERRTAIFEKEQCVLHERTNKYKKQIEYLESELVGKEKEHKKELYFKDEEIEKLQQQNESLRHMHILSNDGLNERDAQSSNDYDAKYKMTVIAPPSWTAKDIEIRVGMFSEEIIVEEIRSGVFEIHCELEATWDLLYNALKGLTVSDKNGNDIEIRVITEESY